MKASARNDARARELGSGFIVVEREKGQAAVFAPRLASAGVIAMMSTKSVNARSPEEVAAWLEGFGLQSEQLAQTEQVHGTDVAQVPPIAAGSADGMWSQTPDVVLSVKAADCAPVWLADTRSQRFALIHAGWRGVSAGIASYAVAALRRAGSRAQDLIAAIGPHLQPCCFEVGPEVGERFSRWPKSVKPGAQLRVARKRDDAFALDLATAIEAQLIDAGVRGEEIFASTACTRCEEQLFHSYRRNGAGGPLMVAVATRRS
ncbi:MAG TPA: peptidoglycan editing factor PgeF [Candidatus Acidoferrales bacterium]|nr:peptidoglycan editing factor PgeF [Candidatus Acidoferrales bacterium]